MPNARTDLLRSMIHECIRNLSDSPQGEGIDVISSLCAVQKSRTSAAAAGPAPDVELAQLQHVLCDGRPAAICSDSSPPGPVAHKHRPSGWPE